MGKTVIATGLMSRLTRRLEVQGYKVGPDFIDPMYHTAATGRPSRNLDSFLMERDVLTNLFGWSSRDADLAVGEGVRGLYDGLTSTGDVGSTAEIAKMIKAPVVLVVNARSLAKSAAAHVLGFKMLDPQVEVAGVILNNIGGERHRRKAVEAVETLTGTEVIGTIDRRQESLPERHLGLMTPPEDDRRELLDQMEDLVSTVDLDRLLAIARGAPENEVDVSPPFERSDDAGDRLRGPAGPRVLLLLPGEPRGPEGCGRQAGDLPPSRWRGAPRLRRGVHGGRLSGGARRVPGVQHRVPRGRPADVRAGEVRPRRVRGHDGHVPGHQRLREGPPDDRIFDADATLTRDRQGLAYVMAEGTMDNFLQGGREVRGHEFHYSRLEPLPPGPFGYVVHRGTGIGHGVDGVMVRRSIGTYFHQHALADARWGEAMVRAAKEGLMNR